MTATASDNVGVKRVDFYDGTTLLGSDSVTPYNFSKAYSFADNGSHSIKAVALDAAGNRRESIQVLNVNIPSPVNDGSWRDDFNNLDTTRWYVSEGWTPFWARNFNSGTWRSQNVWTEGGYLKLRMTLDTTGNGVGAEIASNSVQGYGTYTASLSSGAPAPHVILLLQLHPRADPSPPSSTTSMTPPPR